MKTSEVGSFSAGGWVHLISGVTFLRFAAATPRMHCRELKTGQAGPVDQPIREAPEKDPAAVAFHQLPPTLLGDEGRSSVLPTDLNRRDLQDRNN